MQVNMAVSTEKGKFFITDVFWDRTNAEMFGYIKPLFHSKKLNVDIFMNPKNKDKIRYAAIRKSPKDVFTKRIEEKYGKIAKNVTKYFIIEEVRNGRD